MPPKRRLSFALPTRKSPRNRQTEELGEASSSSAAAAAETTTTTTESEVSSFSSSSSSSVEPPTEASSHLQHINPPPLHPLQRRRFNRPAPVEGPCLVCMEADSVPPTPCCTKPLCDDCLLHWLEMRRITCPHCRERLPNDIIISNQEASDALLADPDFQLRIRAVSFGILKIHGNGSKLCCF